jgi:serine/threonine protein kinase
VQGATGTLEYMAPEVLQGTSYDPQPADIWSIGVILFCMLSGNFPFADKRAILAVDYEIPPYFTIPMRSLISSILQRDPKRRPSIQTIRNSELMRSVTPTTSLLEQFYTALKLKRESEEAGLCQSPSQRFRRASLSVVFSRKVTTALSSPTIHGAGRDVRLVCHDRLLSLMELLSSEFFLSNARACSVIIVFFTPNIISALQWRARISFQLLALVRVPLTFFLLHFDPLTAHSTCNSSTYLQGESTMRKSNLRNINWEDAASDPAMGLQMSLADELGRCSLDSSVLPVEHRVYTFVNIYNLLFLFSCIMHKAHPVSMSASEQNDFFGRRHHCLSFEMVRSYFTQASDTSSFSHTYVGQPR